MFNIYMLHCSITFDKFKLILKYIKLNNSRLNDVQRYNNKTRFNKIYKKFFYSFLTPIYYKE